MARRRRKKNGDLAFETIGIGIVLVAIAVYVWQKNKAKTTTPTAPVGDSLATGKVLDQLGIGTDAAAKALASADPIGAALASGGI